MNVMRARPTALAGAKSIATPPRLWRWLILLIKHGSHFERITYRSAKPLQKVSDKRRPSSAKKAIQSAHEATRDCCFSKLGDRPCNAGGDNQEQFTWQTLNRRAVKATLHSRDNPFGCLAAPLTSERKRRVLLAPAFVAFGNGSRRGPFPFSLEEHEMKGFVVEIASQAVADSAPPRYYVISETDALAVQHAAAHLNRDPDQLRVLRSMADWEIEVFALMPGEVRRSP